jgi:hypothetical protein
MIVATSYFAAGSQNAGSVTKAMQIAHISLDMIPSRRMFWISSHPRSFGIVTSCCSVKSSKVSLGTFT